MNTSVHNGRRKMFFINISKSYLKGRRKRGEPNVALRLLRLAIMPVWPQVLLWERQFDFLVNCLACTYSPGPISCPPLTSLMALEVWRTLSILINSLQTLPRKQYSWEDYQLLGILGLESWKSSGNCETFPMGSRYLNLLLSRVAPLDLTTVSITNIHLF